MKICFPSLAAVVLAAGAAAQSAPCFETNFGVNIGAGDDTVSYNNLLGFSFPGPAGPVTSIDISSNGFVWLASSNDNGCCGGYLPSFLTGLPRIAVMWGDLNPGAAGAVWFNTFPASGTQPARPGVTWG